MRKTKPLRKQRSKPQVSAVFHSASIEIQAECINPQYPFLSFKPKILERVMKIVRDINLRSTYTNLLWGIADFSPCVWESLERGRDVEFDVSQKAFEVVVQRRRWTQHNEPNTFWFLETQIQVLTAICLRMIGRSSDAVLREPLYSLIRLIPSKVIPCIWYRG